MSIRHRMRALWFSCWALGVLFSLAGVTPAQAVSRSALQTIVQQQCLPHWLQLHAAIPCLQVQLPEPGAAGIRDGYALLADIKGGAHLLLIPLRTLSGIESPELLQPETPNYFAAAWQARSALAARAGRALTPDEVGLAINSRYSRGQDQLHIHIECQGVPLHAALSSHAAELGPHWIPLEIQGDRYLVRRINGPTLDGTDPFRLLNAQVPEARGHMELYTLIVGAVRFADEPGFAVLARRAVMRGGEALLDSSCAVASH